MTEIIAEVSNAHNGDLARAFRLLDAAKHAGATSAKFQCYLPDELIALRGDGPAPEPWASQGFTMKALYEKAQTPHAWFPELVGYCNRIGMPWFSSVFGPDSLALLESLGCPRYKLASLDYAQYGWRKTVQYTNKPLIISFNGAHAPTDCTHALYCPGGYPQPAFHLSNIRNGYHGFSYHGTDAEVPVVAVACGAKIIECHFQLADEPSELESNVSLNEYQFEQMTKDIRRVEEMIA